MPFGRDLAPAMLHRHPGHGEAVARISWCVDQRAIGVITGEVGAGKTVAVRAATAALDPSRHVIIYLANPTIGVRGMLIHIVAALGHTPAFHKATLAPRPPTPWPANTQSAAATRSWSSTRPTCSTTSSSKPSDYSPTTTWTPDPHSPSYWSANPPCGSACGSACSPRWTSASPCATRSAG